MINFSMPEVQPTVTIQQLIHIDDIVKNVSFDPEVEVKLDVETTISDNLEILSKIPLPSHINKSDLENRIKEMAKESFDTNPMFKEASKLSKYANDFQKFFSLYFQKVFDFHERIITQLQQNLLINSNIFMQSDLPPAFLKELNLSTITEIKTVQLVDKRLRHERSALFGAKDNNIKFGRICQSHNQWVKPLIEKLEEMSTARVSLVWYLDFQNSKDINEIFKSKIIYEEKLDKETIKTLINKLQETTNALRKILIKYDKETFLSTISSDDFTMKLFSNMMPILVAG